MINDSARMRREIIIWEGRRRPPRRKSVNGEKKKVKKFS